MSFDDELRDAFERSAPAAPNASRVRGELGPAMVRARRNHRVRRGIAATTLSLAVAGGGVAAALQLSGGPDSEIDTHTSSLPAPETTEASSPTTEPPTTPPTTPPPPPTDPPTSAPPETTSTLRTTTTVADVPRTQSGPHVTPCGSVTFLVDTVVVVGSHTVEPGYVFSTEDEGSTEVHAKWSEGPADECQIEAHLEDGELEVHFDEE